MEDNFKEIKAYKARSLNGTLRPNSVYYVLPFGATSVYVYVTDIDGNPIPLKDLNSGSGASGVQLVANTDGTITVTGSTNVNVRLSDTMYNLITSALQAGDNISSLTNNLGYITLADIPTFDPTNYDLEDFNNLGLDPYVKESEISLPNTYIAFGNTLNKISSSDNLTYDGQILLIKGNGQSTGWGQVQFTIESTSSESALSLKNSGAGGKTFNILSTNNSSGIGGGKFCIGDATSSENILEYDSTTQEYKLSKLGGNGDVIVFSDNNGKLYTGQAPTFDPSIHDLSEFINADTNYFIRVNDLATVATTGDYNDLTNTPIITGATNLSYTSSPTQGIVNSDTGNDATLPLVDNTNAGLQSPADKIKLDGIASNANIGVVPNISITGDTKTKITYDSKGLVTAGADANTDDIQEVGIPTNKWWTNARTITSTLVGYVSGAGAISASDTILQAIQKLNGNIASLVTGVSSVFGRTGVVTAQSGDYNTSQVTENTNLYFTTARVLATVLSGLSLATGGAIVSTDTVLVAFGKIQKQINDLSGVYQAILVSGTNIKTVNGSTLLGSGNLSVGDALVSSSLAQFAPTTSAQLATLLTDETGTGLNVFNNSPTLISPILTGVASPTYTQGKLLYDTDNECLTFYNNDSNVSLQIGQEAWVRVKNVSGSTIPNGSSVYINGSSSGLPTIALAQANSATTTIGLGLATESIANNSIGFVTSLGVVNGLDTSSFSIGAIYISSSVAGGLTQTIPTSPNYRYRIGFVTSISATTGTIHVTPSTASLGNGTADQFSSINAAGTAQEYKTIQGTTNQITVTQGVGTTTLSIPSSASLPGNPTTTTQSQADNSTNIATTAYVDTLGALKLNTASPSYTGLMSGTGTAQTGSSAIGLVDLAQTWNTTGIPTAIKLNVTNTASNSSSLLIDLQTNGISRFKVNTTGLITCVGGLSAPSGDITGKYIGASGALSNGYSSGFKAFGTAFAHTSGEKTAFTDELLWSPTSGTGTKSSYTFSGTINQTGTASGITRGIYITPTLTSAIDFRAIDVVSGSIKLPYLARTSTYSISPNDHFIDVTSGTFTITLPTAVGCTGKIYVIKNSGSGTLTVATTSSQTIDGATTKILNTQYAGLQLRSDGANWKITGVF